MSHQPFAALRASLEAVRPRSDAELVASILAGGDEAGFEQLVRRHGPMVLRVCRNVLGHRQDAEDAFQATLIVLLRRVATIRKPDSLASWLHGVAVRVSQELLATRQRHATSPLEDEAPSPEGPCPVEQAESAALLDAEVAGLPAHYRAPVVLCELLGRSRRDAANELGIREGTLSSRLAKAKRLLAERLAGRTSVAVALGAMLGGQALAGPVPAVLVRRTVHLLVGVSLGQPTAGKVPAAVDVIANGVATAMRSSSLRGVVLAVALLFVGFGGLVASAWPEASVKTVTPSASFADTSAAPTPLEAKPENRIWVRYDKTGLVALTPTGETVRKVPLKDGAVVVDISPATDRLWFAGQNGQSVEPAADGHWPEGPLTLHSRAINDKTTGDDLGIAMTRHSILSPDGKMMGKVVMKQFAQGPNPQPFIYENTLVDVGTKKVTALGLPDQHQLFGIAPDRSWALTLEYNSPAVEVGSPPYRLFRVPLDRGKPRLLSGTLSTLFPCRISPDGSRALTFAHDLQNGGAGDWDLAAYIIDVGSGKATRFATEKKRFWAYGVWSPDSKRLAYAWRAWDDGDKVDINGIPPTRLVVCDADGKNAATILTSEENFKPMVWW